MANFTLVIEMDNEAFAESETQEVARILEKVAKELRQSDHTIEAFNGDKLRDYNGNSVGRITIADF